MSKSTTAGLNEQSPLLVVKETAKLFSKMVVPFSILTGNVWVIQLLQIPTSIWGYQYFFLVILIGIILVSITQKNRANRMYTYRER